MDSAGRPPSGLHDLGHWCVRACPALCPPGPALAVGRLRGAWEPSIPLHQAGGYGHGGAAARWTGLAGLRGAGRGLSALTASASCPVLPCEPASIGRARPATGAQTRSWGSLWPAEPGPEAARARDVLEDARVPGGDLSPAAPLPPWLSGGLVVPSVGPRAARDLYENPRLSSGPRRPSKARPRAWSWGCSCLKELWALPCPAACSPSRGHLPPLQRPAQSRPLHACPTALLATWASLPCLLSISLCPRPHRHPSPPALPSPAPRPAPGCPGDLSRCSSDRGPGGSAVLLCPSLPPLATVRDTAAGLPLREWSGPATVRAGRGAEGLRRGEAQFWFRFRFQL